MKIFIIFSCFMAAVIADSSEKNPICDKDISVKPTDCCPTLPNLETYFDACKQQCNVTATTEAPTTTTAAPQKGRRGEKRQEQRGGKGRDGKGRGMRGQWQCVVTCVVQSAGIADPAGNISKDLLTQKLSSGAAPEWAQIIPTVVSDCFDNATAMAAKRAEKKDGEQPEGPSSNGTQSFNRMNGMILKCVFANTLAQCPSLVNSTDCNDLVTKMTQCPCKHNKGNSGERGGSRRNEQGGKNRQEGGKGRQGGNQEKQEGGKGRQEGGRGKQQGGRPEKQEGGRGQNQRQTNKQAGQ